MRIGVEELHEFLNNIYISIVVLAVRKEILHDEALGSSERKHQRCGISRQKLLEGTGRGAFSDARNRANRDRYLVVKCYF